MTAENRLDATARIAVLEPLRAVSTLLLELRGDPSGLEPLLRFVAIMA